MTEKVVFRTVTLTLTDIERIGDALNAHCQSLNEAIDRLYMFMTNAQRQKVFDERAARNKLRQKVMAFYG